MSDGFLLCQYGLPNEVIDRNDSADRIIFENRQVPYIFFGHQLHAKFDGIV